MNQFALNLQLVQLTQYILICQICMSQQPLTRQESFRNLITVSIVPVVQTPPTVSNAIGNIHQLSSQGDQPIDRQNQRLDSENSFLPGVNSQSGFYEEGKQKVFKEQERGQTNEGLLLLRKVYQKKFQPYFSPSSENYQTKLPSEISRLNSDNEKLNTDNMQLKIKNKKLTSQLESTTAENQKLKNIVQAIRALIQSQNTISEQVGKLHSNLQGDQR